MRKGVSVERVEGVWVGFAVVRDVVFGMTVGGSVMTVSVGGGGEGVAVANCSIVAVAVSLVGVGAGLLPHADNRTLPSIKNIIPAILVFICVYSLTRPTPPQEDLTTDITDFTDFFSIRVICVTCACAQCR
jgi:hypothetical protein